MFQARPAEKFDLEYVANLYNDPKNNRYLLRGKVTVKDLKKVKRQDWILYDAQDNKVGWFGIFKKGVDRARFAVIVDSSFQGRGFGKFALKVIESECRKANIKTIEFDVHSDNAAAIHIYEAAGFEKQYSLHRYEKLLK